MGKFSGALGLLLVCGVCPLTGKEKEPPHPVRVSVEFIEVSRGEFLELEFGSGAGCDDVALRQRLARLVGEGKAKVVESMMCAGGSPQRTSIGSIEEFRYPTGYVLGGLPWKVYVSKDGKFVKLPGWEFAVGPSPFGFCTRDLGSKLNFEAVGGTDRQLWLKLRASVSSHAGEVVWAEWNGRHGKAPVCMPLVHELSVETTIFPTAGRPMLVAAVSPKGKNGLPDFARKWMVFVRFDELGKLRKFNPPPPPEPGKDDVPADPFDDSEETDPFADPGFAYGGPPPPSRCRHIRTHLQIIEIAPADLADLMTTADRPVLHARALALVASGKAKILESALLCSLVGRHASFRSMIDFHYPTTREDFNTHGYGPPPDDSEPARAATWTRDRPARVSHGFMSRNVGISLETEASIAWSDDETIELRLSPEFVELDSLTTWQRFVDRWGDASVRTPLFDSWETNTSLNLKPGRFQLVSIHTESPDPPSPVVPKKWLVFARCDVVTPSIVPIPKPKLPESDK